MLPGLRSLWRVLRGRARFERELDDELRFHLDSRAEDLVREGLSPEAARRQARLELGAPEAYKDEVRESRGLRLLDDLAADVRFAARSWQRHRALALAVIITLTVGIGVSTAVFTLVNAFMFRAYGVPDPASLARVFVAQARAPERPDDFDDPQPGQLPALLQETSALAVVGAIRAVSAPMDQDPGEVSGRLVTCNVFRLHGSTRPLLGRLLDAGDCAAAARVLVLSEPFWRRRFGADPGVVGKVVRYNDQPFVVVGVAEASFNARGTRGAVWLPYTLAGDWPAEQRWQARFQVVGRLRSGASHRQAQGELQGHLAAQDGLHPGQSSRVLVTNGSLWQEPGHLPAKLMIVSLIVGGLAMIVLLAAANVVTLLLSRAHARRQEVAVRLALGAGRGRLMKMLLTETLLLACLAAGLSLLVARQLPPLLLLWLAPGPIDLGLQLDWRVWSFLIAVTMVAALGSGLTPSLETLNLDLVQVLKGRPGQATGRRSRGRSLLMGVQVALSLALLAGAALFARSYLAMPGRETAFPSRQALFGPISPRPSRSPTPVPWADIQAQVAAAAGTVPGVRGVAFSSHRPPGGRRLRLRSDGGQQQTAASNAVSSTYFQSFGLRILRGRAVRAEDARATPLPVVISQRLAQSLWSGADPLGQRLDGADGRRFQVVGVATDLVVPGEADGHNLYSPLVPGRDLLLVRFDGEAGPVVAGVRATIARVAPGMTVSLRTFQDRFEQQAAELKPAAGVTLILGLVALVLSLVGVHGVASFAARRQLKEIGVRMALGASSGDVLRALLRPALRSLALGVGGGLLVTLAAAPALAHTVQEMNVWDPLPYAGAALLLSAVALLAMVRPARWALAVDPAVVLREE